MADQQLQTYDVLEIQSNRKRAGIPVDDGNRLTIRSVTIWQNHVVRPDVFEDLDYTERCAR